MTGRDLRHRRQLLDLTQAQLADRLKVAPTTIARWEQGKSPIPGFLELAMKELARAIEVAPADLTDPPSAL